MRTFHIGGTAQVVDQSFIEVELRGHGADPQPQRRAQLRRRARSPWAATCGRDRRARTARSARCTACQYGARLKVDEGDKVKRGQRIAEWDPYTRPILTEVDGIVAYEDLVEGISVARDDRRVDRHHQARRHRLARQHPRGATSGRRSPCQDGKGKIAKLPRGGEARYLLPVDAILSVEPGAQGEGRRRARAYPDGERQDPRHHRRSAAGGGAVRGASSEGSRDHRRESTARSSSAATTRTSAASRSSRQDGSEPVEYLIPKGKHIHLQDGDIVEKGDYIVDGNPAPHDILAIKGVEELAAYLVNEIQEVYRLQGVNINDKHIEVIVRQMLQKVEIDRSRRDRASCTGEQVDRLEFDEVNVQARGGGQAPGRRPSRAARHHQGQPADALVHLGGLVPGDHPRPHRGGGQRQGRTTLEGLKENVIVGRLIPAGTGALMTRLREVAARRDELIVEQKATETQKPANVPAVEGPKAAE